MPPPRPPPPAASGLPTQRLCLPTVPFNACFNSRRYANDEAFGPFTPEVRGGVPALAAGTRTGMCRGEGGGQRAPNRKLDGRAAMPRLLNGRAAMPWALPTPPPSRTLVPALFMTSIQAEKLNGRAAMVGFGAMIILEAIKGGPLF